MQIKKTSLCLILFGIIISSLSSCGVFRGTNASTDISINNSSKQQIEALKREEYKILSTTNGKANSSTIYLLFFPIGKHRTNTELYESAYYDAVENLQNCDGIILPRQKIKRLVVPLLLVNYSRRTMDVSGLGVSVKEKNPVKDEVKK